MVNSINYILFVAVIILFYLFSGDKKPEVTKTPTQLASERSSEQERECNRGSWGEAKPYIEKLLKAPSTAVFPWHSQEFRVPPLSDCIHTYVSHVDAQNSFGAKIRSTFAVSIQYDKTINRWKLYKLIFDGKQIFSMKESEKKTSAAVKNKSKSKIK